MTWSSDGRQNNVFTRFKILPSASCFVGEALTAPSGRGSGLVPAEVEVTCVEGEGEGVGAGGSADLRLGLVVLVGGAGKASAASFASRSWVKYRSCCCCWRICGEGAASGSASDSQRSSSSASEALILFDLLGLERRPSKRSQRARRLSSSSSCSRAISRGGAFGQACMERSDTEVGPNDTFLLKSDRGSSFRADTNAACEGLAEPQLRQKRTPSAKLEPQEQLAGSRLVEGTPGSEGTENCGSDFLPGAWSLAKSSLFKCFVER